LVQGKFAPNLGELRFKLSLPQIWGSYWVKRNGMVRAEQHTQSNLLKKNNYKYKIKSVCVLLLIEKKAECKKGASNRVGNKKKKKG